MWVIAYYPESGTAVSFCFDEYDDYAEMWVTANITGPMVKFGEIH